MTSLLAGERAPDEQRFCHEAFLYSGTEEFVEGTAAFVREAVAAGEPVLVVVSGPKIELLRRALGPDAAMVQFADMGDVGRNPARIIPAWHDFVAERSAGGPVRGVGEPISPDRSPAALVECQTHEALLNAAFAGSPAWWLLCPYDTDALPADVIEEARRTHRYVLHDGSHHPSPAYRDADADSVFARPLPEAPGRADELSFRYGPMSRLRRFVARQAAAFGLDDDRTADLVVAVTEVATNSVRHGGGSGLLRIWSEGDDFVCEIHDRGRIDELLVGRRRPADHRTGGRGLWIANQLCDLVEIRSSPSGTVIRLHVTRV